MNNDKTVRFQTEVEFPKPTRPAPPMPECKPARNISEARSAAACATLERLCYTWAGGEEWKPPLGAVPKFMQDTLDRVNAAAGLKPFPGETACNFRNRILAQVDSSLETTEDEARPYRAGDEKAGQVVDAAYWVGDEDAIRKALVELHDITRTITGQDWGLPLWQPGHYEKLAEVLRKTLADQRAALKQDMPADPTTYLVGVKFSTSDATKIVEDAIAASGYPWTAAARDVLAERKRQQEVEGWTPERDDKYIDCDLAAAAATYALCTKPHQLKVCDVVAWPWPIHWWKPTTYRRNLEKAGALIIAEIERLDRAAEKGGAA